MYAWLATRRPLSVAREAAYVTHCSSQLQHCMTTQSSTRAARSRGRNRTTRSSPRSSDTRRPKAPTRSPTSRASSAFTSSGDTMVARLVALALALQTSALVAPHAIRDDARRHGLRLRGHDRGRTRKGADAAASRRRRGPAPTHDRRHEDDSERRRDREGRGRRVPAEFWLTLLPGAPRPAGAEALGTRG